MSFILDALRKSEHERQRGAVPGISNVPFAAPRRETPRWMVALVAVLLLAVVALGGAWWRSAKVAPPPAVATVPLDVPPPVSAPAPDPRAARSEAAPAETARAERVEPPPEAAPPPADARPIAPPAAEAAAAPARAPVPATREDGPAAPPLPSVTALAAEGIAVPPLHLELHAYSDRASERFVFINGRKYVEGEQLAEGPRLLSIERSGAVLSQQGRRFLLTQ